MANSLKATDYDGIYFLPGENENELILSYFNFKKEMANGIPIESSTMGNKYHIAFFKRDEEGNPVFDDTFEAILVDPSVWISNLAGAGVYGCAVKKTHKSEEWFNDYLNTALERVTVKKMIGALNSILDNKTS